jgi:tRNA threonylcarbamoyladenosine biosynthesis protein TsaB
MEFYMLVLALDTTTRRGSVALARDGAIMDARAGDPAITHGQRLPDDLIRLLDRHSLRVGDIDLFAVAAGPGSFTGLRIGIASMQGLALANGKDVVGISALDALHHASISSHASLSSLALHPSSLTSDVSDSCDVGVWMDAQRGEVFSALYRNGVVVDGPSVEKPEEVLALWASRSRESSHQIMFVGEGAIVYAGLIRAELPAAKVRMELPMLAPSIALLAEAQAGRQGSSPPDAIRPLYVRRPDAELARDRKAGR